jgi:hypothetical protein
MTKKDDERDQIVIEVGTTLASHDHQEEIEVGPYFYSRLRARISDSEKVTPSVLERLLVGRRLAPSLLVFVIVLNVFTAVMVIRGSTASRTQPTGGLSETGMDEYLSTGASGDLDVVSK